MAAGVRTAEMVVFVHGDETECVNRGREYDLAAVLRDELVEMPRPGLCWYCGVEPRQVTPTETVMERIRGKVL